MAPLVYDYQPNVITQELCRDYPPLTVDLLGEDCLQPVEIDDIDIRVL